jgi:hypothetical protein
MQDLEALWSLLFAAGNTPSVSAGVVVLETGRIFGGDSWYYYTGSYEGRSGKLAARVTITHYAGPIGSPLLGNRLQGSVELTETERGTDGDGHRTISLNGRLVENPSQILVARLTWRAALPG